MNTYDQETEILFNKINQNSTNARNKYEEAFKRSQSQQQIKYEKQTKQRKNDNIKRAIITIALTGALAAGITAGMINNKNVVIPTSSVSTTVDENIAQYENLMDSFDPTNSIETFLGQPELRDIEIYNVIYTTDNINNLANHIVEASKISEYETRCTMIAAYRIINPAKRNEVFEKALATASANQDENSNYIIPNTTQEFLEKLGYKNWKEYHQNERENIKELKAAEEYVGGKNR